MNKSSCYLITYLFLLLIQISSLYGQNLSKKIYVNKEIVLTDSANIFLFRPGKEITKLLLDGVKENKIIGYKDYLFKEKISNDELVARLVILGGTSGYDTINKRLTFYPGHTKFHNKDYGFGFEDYTIDSFDSNDTTFLRSCKPNYYLSNELNLLNLREEININTRSNKSENSIISLSVNIPADNPSNMVGEDMEIVAFKFADILNFFQNNKDAKYNNTLNYADALMLGMYNSTIIRITTIPEDRLFIFDSKVNDYVIKQGLENNLLYKTIYFIPQNTKTEFNGE